MPICLVTKNLTAPDSRDPIYGMLPAKLLNGQPASKFKLRDGRGRYAFNPELVDRRVDPEGAHVACWHYAGAFRVFRIGDKVSLKEDEFLFVQNRYPGLLDFVATEIDSADSAALMLVERERQMGKQLNEVQSALNETTAKLEDADQARVRAEGRAAELAAELEQLKAQLAKQPAAPTK